RCRSTTSGSSTCGCAARWLAAVSTWTCSTSPTEATPPSATCSKTSLAGRARSSFPLPASRLASVSTRASKTPRASARTRSPALRGPCDRKLAIFEELAGPAQQHTPAGFDDSVSDPSGEIQGVSKRFGDFVAVDGVSLAIRRGEFFSLLGPSACGKTTLLRMIGGFELPTLGSIRVEDVDVTELPPHRRPVNMVFQHYPLFPHLTVAENITFGFRYKGFPRETYAARVREAVELVRLEGFEAGYPHQLSGGPRQRGALARALALPARVLLLDEPLGALDQKLRKEVQVQLKHLQRELGITFVFVTHDQEEALTMSDRIAVMNRGRVEQVDEAARVFERPA